MKTTRLTALAVSILWVDVCMMQTIQAADYTVTSPDGDHSIVFTVSSGKLYYSVSYRDTAILLDSRLSLSLDGEALPGNLQVDRSRTISKNGSWVPVVGSKSSYPDAYNERDMYLHWYDQMDQYEGKSFPELEFWKEMPTTWDDSKGIHGSIGNDMTVARRKGKSWFVGTITNDGRRLDIPLYFLGSGTYTARIYKEAPKNKKHVTIESLDVTSRSSITASMSSASGHAMLIYPAESR